MEIVSKDEAMQNFQPDEEAAIIDVEPEELRSVSDTPAISLEYEDTGRDETPTKIQSRFKAQYLHRVHAKWSVKEGNSPKIQPSECKYIGLMDKFLPKSFGNSRKMCIFAAGNGSNGQRYGKGQAD